MNGRTDALKAGRMARGEMKHVPPDLETGPRDFIQQGVEELIGFLNYLELAMFQGELSFCRWASIDKNARFLIWRLEGKDGTNIFDY